MSDLKSEDSHNTASTKCSPFKMEKKQLVLAIEGNIGVGKTTFLSLIKEKLEVEFEVIDEPVDVWQNIKQGDHNLLDLFYKDPKRWGFTFQTYAFMSRLRHWRALMNRKSVASQDRKVFISERSMMSDNKVFAQNCYENGYLNEAEMAIYQEQFDLLTKEMSQEVDGVIYLRAQPATCYQRCQKRNRSEESSISLEYLSTVHDKHEAWLGQGAKKQLTLEMDENYLADENLQKAMLKKVSAFIEVLTN